MSHSLGLSSVRQQILVGYSRGCFLKTSCYRGSRATVSIGKTTYNRGRLDEYCRVIEVNLTLSGREISRGFEKFMYYRGFCGIEGRTTEVYCN
jgi:hypothetical protein